MKIVVLGDCEKYDFIVVTAVLLQCHSGSSVAIVSDNYKNYQYFDGEISGVTIFMPEEEIKADIVLYDWHDDFSIDIEDAKVVFATSYERRSLERIETLLKEGYNPSAMIVMEEECGIDLKYVEKNIPISTSLYAYMDSGFRKIDWLYDGRINWKVDKEFVEAVNDFLVEICDIPQSNLKKLWKYARKRG